MPLLKFRNFLAASRKPNMLPFGMYRAEASADIDVIEDYGTLRIGSGLGITGVQDGVNTVFIMSDQPALVFLNGLYQTVGIDYSVNVNIVTFTIAPLADDIISALGAAP